MLILPVMMGPRAFAQGTGSANAQISVPTSTAGFCVDNDPEKDPEITGLCGQMTRQFNVNADYKKLIELLRKRILGEGEPDGKGGRRTVDLGFSCSGDSEGQSLRDLAKNNPAELTNLLKQYCAMLIAQHSGWNVLKDNERGSKGPGGILPLTLGDGSITDMNKPEYEGACKDKVSTAQDQTGVTVAGQSPGPLDSFHSVTCGPYMILAAIAADGGTSGGDPKSTDPDKKPRGAAKILPDLFSQDPEKAKKLDDWREKKMATFCKQYWKSGGRTNRYHGPTNDDIGSEQFGNSGQGNATK